MRVCSQRINWDWKIMPLINGQHKLCPRHQNYVECVLAYDGDELEFLNFLFIKRKMFIALCILYI